MGDVQPAVLLGLIDKEKLGELDRAVYEGTKRFMESCKTSHLR
jgi:hypothetical protein